MLLDPLKQFPHPHAFCLDVVDYINRVGDIFIYTSLRVFTFITWFSYTPEINDCIVREKGFNSISTAQIITL
jgi:hypothetical protein